MDLILISLAPIVIILLYVYFRDKYEKEPIRLLIKALIGGIIIVLPVLLVGSILGDFYSLEDGLFGAFWNAFVVAAFTEELFKYLAIMLIIWRNPNFNEKFDGIVYAVFVSLGFAMVENIMYVTGYGMDVGLSRAWTAVPAHAIFGITMGYYLGIARMYGELQKIYLRKAFLVPFLLHGIYDFILMSGLPFLLALFIPFLIYLYVNGLKKMKVISEASIFKDIE
jgi:RsiW-degrading membrane proteinase PrsW (M82 family)